MCTHGARESLPHPCNIERQGQHGCCRGKGRVLGPAAAQPGRGGCDMLAVCVASLLFALALGLLASAAVTTVGMHAEPAPQAAAPPPRPPIRSPATSARCTRTSSNRRARQVPALRHDAGGRQPPRHGQLPARGRDGARRREGRAEDEVPVQRRRPGHPQEGQRLRHRPRHAVSPVRGQPRHHGVHARAPAPGSRWRVRDRADAAEGRPLRPDLRLLPGRRQRPGADDADRHGGIRG